MSVTFIVRDDLVQLCKRLGWVEDTKDAVYQMLFEIVDDIKLGILTVRDLAVAIREYTNADVSVDYIVNVLEVNVVRRLG